MTLQYICIVMVIYKCYSYSFSTYDITFNMLTLNINYFKYTSFTSSVYTYILLQ